MRKSKFTPEQILQTLRQAEGGTTVVDICRKLGAATPQRSSGALGPTCLDLELSKSDALIRTYFGDHAPFTELT